MNGFIFREEVKDLVEVLAEDVNAPKFFDQLGLEDVPVGDVVEGTSLVLRKGLEGEDEFDGVVAFGEVKSL